MNHCSDVPDMLWCLGFLECCTSVGSPSACGARPHRDLSMLRRSRGLLRKKTRVRGPRAVAPVATAAGASGCCRPGDDRCCEWQCGPHATGRLLIQLAWVLLSAQTDTCLWACGCCWRGPRLLLLWRRQSRAVVGCSSVFMCFSRFTCEDSCNRDSETQTERECDPRSAVPLALCIFR